MKPFLAVQNRYHDVEIGLFDDTCMIEHTSIDKRAASKLLIPTIKTILEKHRVPLETIPFIAVNQGPAPFTTLRVVLATVNGLSFATGIPLIGIDAFDALHAAWQSDEAPTTIIMFNAFARDVYFAITDGTTLIQKGYCTIDELCKKAAHLPTPIRCIGNGVPLYEERLRAQLGNHLIIPDPNPEYCALSKIAQLAYARWKIGDRGFEQLLPLFLKKHPAQLTISTP